MKTLPVSITQAIKNGGLVLQSNNFGRWIHPPQAWAYGDNYEITSEGITPETAAEKLGTGFDITESEGKLTITVLNGTCIKYFATRRNNFSPDGEINTTKLDFTSNGPVSRVAEQGQHIVIRSNPSLTIHGYWGTPIYAYNGAVLGCEQVLVFPKAKI